MPHARLQPQEFPHSSRTAPSLRVRLVLCGILVIGGCTQGTPPGASAPPLAGTKPKSESAGSVAPADLEAQINAFCGACHGVPAPGNFPKSAWHEEVNKGFNFYFESGRSDLKPPPMVEVVDWYRERAPRELVVPLQAEIETSPRVPLRLEPLLTAGNFHKSNSGIASLAWRSLAEGKAAELILCDMRWGGVRSLQPTAPRQTLRTIADLANPCHAEACDLDRDGLIDLIVADLGSFLPQDHQKGRVIWLRRTPDDQFETHVIQDGIGRVADVEPADFDGDGDLDLVVAEFGWRKTGRVLLLEQLPGPAGTPTFDRRVVDGRHGAIHVPVVDLNGDGRLDFIALLSQEHEIIEAFINAGDLKFTRETIFAGDDPAFGSTGIQVIDFDADGDMDVLATNGDMFDTFYIKPYHGIRWLENCGEFPWNEHLLAEMPGVHRALAGDIDGDGDLDIVATSLLPANIAGNQIRPDFNAVLWLEQTEPGTFASHGLLKAHGRFPSLELADFDADGDLDFAIGGMREEDHTPALAVFWNDRITTRTAEE